MIGQAVVRSVIVVLLAPHVKSLMGEGEIQEPVLNRSGVAGSPAL